MASLPKVDFPVEKVWLVYEEKDSSPARKQKLVEAMGGVRVDVGDVYNGDLQPDGRASYIFFAGSTRHARLLKKAFGRTVAITDTSQQGSLSSWLLGKVEVRDTSDETFACAAVAASSSHRAQKPA